VVPVLAAVAGNSAAAVVAARALPVVWPVARLAASLAARLAARLAAVKAAVVQPVAAPLGPPLVLVLPGSTAEMSAMLFRAQSMPSIMPAVAYQVPRKPD
jgi:hypothetical protein